MTKDECIERIVYMLRILPMGKVTKIYGKALAIWEKEKSQKVFIEGR